MPKLVLIWMLEVRLVLTIDAIHLQAVILVILIFSQILKFDDLLLIVFMRWQCLCWWSTLVSDL